MSTHDTQSTGRQRETPEHVFHVYSSRSDEDMELRSIWNALVRDRWIVIVLSLLGLAGAAYYAWHAPSWYRAEVDVLPEIASAAIDPELKLSAVDGLAHAVGRLSGLNLKQQLLATVRSREFARGFLIDEGLVETVCRVVGAKPDLETAVAVFAGGMTSVREDAATGVVTLGVEWPDPATAADLANRMVARINRVSREEAISQASTSIEFLQGQLKESQDIVFRQVLGRLLEGEYQKLVLAKGQSEFAVRIIDSAHAAASVREPRRGMVAAAGLAGGFVLALLAVLARSLSRRTASAAGADEQR